MMASVSARGLVKQFAGRRASESVTALRGVDLDVEAGEMVSIVGPSGSGKSTLLYCLAGIEAVSDGTISLLGTEIVGLRPTALARLRRDHLGFVFQAYNLLPSLNARDNVALPARLARRKASMEKAREALASVGMSERESFLPAELSGGQQQRVAVARVLASAPELVFADEPTGALDSQTGGEVLRLLRSAATGLRSLVLVTHDLEAASMADRVFVMRDGRIEHMLASPTARELFDATETVNPPLGNKR